MLTTVMVKTVNGVFELNFEARFMRLDTVRTVKIVTTVI
jgi:hypothetical protein